MKENDDVVEYDDEDEVINVSSDGNYGYNEEELDKPDEINDDEGKEFDDEDDDGFIDESLDKNVVNSSANNHSHTTGNVKSSSHPVSALKEQIMTSHEQNETNDIQAEPTPSQSSTTALTSSGDTET
ncbi:unnamed protein product [Clavelina lepadiformis]|uniref:Uncharacterized protein n=1 Tax=Clavelina lepadiformis TaxID=159417 RepID=A0ABP0GE14_CLALP